MLKSKKLFAETGGELWGPVGNGQMSALLFAGAKTTHSACRLWPGEEWRWSYVSVYVSSKGDEGQSDWME